MVRGLLILGSILAAACGRVGFDDLGAGSGSGAGDADAATFAIVQHLSGRATVDPATADVLLASPVAVGDVLVVAIDHSPKAGEALTITDTRGSVFATLMGPVGDAKLVEWLLVAPVTTAGADRITAVASIAPDNFFEVRVHEVHGLRTDIAAAPTAVVAGQANPADLIASPPIAVPAHSMMVGFGIAETTLAVGLGYTTIETDYGDLFEYELAEVGGNFTATATDVDGGDWVMSIAALPLQ